MPATSYALSAPEPEAVSSSVQGCVLQNDAGCPVLADGAGGSLSL